MKNELIHPNTLIPQLKEHLVELKNSLEAKQKLQRFATEGHLRIALRDERRLPQSYHITQPNDSKGIYLSHKKIPLIKKLAQKDYDLKLIKILQKQIKALEKYISESDNKIEQLYSNMNTIRKDLIIPATLTNEQYIEEWKNDTWHGLLFAEDAQDFFTANKERVRSKSEVIIADTLARLGIPYKYEYPIELGGKTFHPDFLCLNLRTRQEYIWEHFGMMDSPEYLEKAIQKILIYNENNYFLGKNLIITMETQHNGIKTQQLELIIETYLK